MGNIFKKKLHLGVLARLKILILLAFVIVVGCLAAFVRSFNGFVFGWPLLHPQPSALVSIVFMIAPWILMLYYVDKGEPEQGRVGAAFWFLFVALLLLSVGFWSLFPIRTEGTPEKRGAQYVLIHDSKRKDSESYVIRDLSKEEYELLTTYYVRRNAVRWMVFHGMLMLWLCYWHHKISTGNLKPIKALDPSKMNISQAILALRANAHNAEIWLRLGWMLAREGEAEYARDCYQWALWVNLSNSPTAADLLPSWLNSSSINDSLPSWFNQYKSGVSLFLLWRRFHLYSFYYIFIPPTMSFYLIMWVVVLYPEGGQRSDTLLGLLLVSSGAVSALLTIRWLAGVLHFLLVYLSSRSWPTTDAVVIGSFLRTAHYNRKTCYTINFVVVYNVDEKTFYSTVPSINAYDLAIEEAAIKKFDSFQPACNIQKNTLFEKKAVFYNPSRPHIVLNREKFKNRYIIAVVNIVILALIFAFFSIFLLLRGVQILLRATTG